MRRNFEACQKSEVIHKEPAVGRLTEVMERRSNINYSSILSDKRDLGAASLPWVQKDSLQAP